jgi:hypothetical protein
VGQQAVEGACPFGVKFKAGPGAGCLLTRLLAARLLNFFSFQNRKTEQNKPLTFGVEIFVPRSNQLKLACTRLLLTCTARCALTLLGPLRLRRSPPPWS